MLLPCRGCVARLFTGAKIAWGGWVGWEGCTEGREEQHLGCMMWKEGGSTAASAR